MAMIARSRKVDIGLLAIVGFAVRIWLILAFPMIFGNDTMVRLVNHDKVLMSYQLPLLQVFIYLISQLTSDPFFIRLLMALIGAIAGVGFYLLAEDLSNREAALWAALLFTLNPFVAGFSTVPYQEILMLAGLLFAFHFFFRENWIAASVCLGLACLTRFEAWAACPVLMLAYALRDRPRPATVLKAGLLYGWAPLAWVLFRHGLSPSGSFVVDHSISIWRLQRIVYIAWISAKHTPIPILLLACAGGVVLVAQPRGARILENTVAHALLRAMSALLPAWCFHANACPAGRDGNTPACRVATFQKPAHNATRQVRVSGAHGGRRRVLCAHGDAWQPLHDRRILTLGAFFLLFLIAILFSAHGEPPDPERHVTMREAHIPIAAITLLTAFALARRSRLGVALTALGLVLCVIDCYRFVQAQTSRPDIQLGYQVGRYLDRHTDANDRVIVLANPLRESDLRMYLDKVRQNGGEAALSEARKILGSMDNSPLDYQRILIHSRLGRERLRPSTEPGPAPDWIAAWNDFTPADAQTARWYESAVTHPAAVMRSGDRSVSIRRLD